MQTITTIRYLLHGSILSPAIGWGTETASLTVNWELNDCIYALNDKGGYLFVLHKHLSASLVILKCFTASVA